MFDPAPLPRSRILADSRAASIGNLRVSAADRAAIGGLAQLAATVTSQPTSLRAPICRWLHPSADVCAHGRRLRQVPSKVLVADDP